MEVSGQHHTPAALPPGKEPLVPIGQEAGWDPEPFWTLAKCIGVIITWGVRVLGYSP
jgi:hypothetical protein